MMKKIIYGIIAVAVILVVAGVYCNTNTGMIISSLAKKGDISSGQMVYAIQLFGFIPAGEAVFDVEKQEDLFGVKVYHMSATAETAKALAAFFSARVKLDSFVDRAQLNPLAFTQVLSIKGKAESIKKALYDQRGGTMTTEKGTRAIPPDTQDPLSTMLHFKRMDFDNVKDFDINFNNNQRNYAIKGSVRLEDSLRRGQERKIAFVKAQIGRRDKNPYHRSSVEIVFLRKKENIPILIKVFASGVFINARLKDIR